MPLSIHQYSLTARLFVEKDTLIHGRISHCSQRKENILYVQFSAGGALWKKKALAQLQSSAEAHPDTAEVLKWAESYFGPELWPKWKGIQNKLSPVSASSCTVRSQECLHSVC